VRDKIQVEIGELDGRGKLALIPVMDETKPAAGTRSK